MAWYANISFRWKLGIPLFLLALLFLYVGLYAIKSANILAHDAKIIAKINLPEIQLLIQADRDLYQALTAERALLSPDLSSQQITDYLKEHTENLQQAHDRVVKSLDISDTATDVEKQEYLGYLLAWKIISEGIVKDASGADEETRSTLLKKSIGEGFQSFSSAHNFIDMLEARRLEHVDKFTDDIHKTSDAIVSRLIALLIAGVLTILASAFFIPLMVTVPLNKVCDRIKNIAAGDGDLTIRIHVDREDELGELAKHVNRFMDKLQSMVKEISKNTDEISQAAASLLIVSSGGQRIADEQGQAIAMVVTAVNELTMAIQEVARNTSQAAQSTSEASQITDQGQSRIRLAVSRVQDLSIHVSETALTMEKLENEAKNVTSVIDVIRGVAEQTNLLALNAAIEAARAGEQGRGFAVVADEVRTLASRTQKSTQDIQVMLNQLQVGVQKAVNAMNASTSMTNEAAASASEAGISLSGIGVAVQQINDMAIQIATAAEEQSSVTADIDRNLIHINELAMNNEDGANRTAQESQRLSQLSANLRGVLQQFKV